MPRAYTIATAALVLNVPTKWLDNTLSHFRITGVIQHRQGIARRITLVGLLHISVAHSLASKLGTTVANAVRLALQLSEAGGVIEVAEGIRVHADLERLKGAVLERLEQAVEIAPTPRRGRPPKNKTGRLD
jgi:hypothetical protein